MVSKQELLDAIWPDIFVTDDGLVHCVVEIRRVLGDNPREPRYVETVPRRGYSFIAPVQSARRAVPSTDPEPAPPRAPRRSHPPGAAWGSPSRGRRCQTRPRGRVAG